MSLQALVVQGSAPAAWPTVSGAQEPKVSPQFPAPHAPPYDWLAEPWPTVSGAQALKVSPQSPVAQAPVAD